MSVLLTFKLNQLSEQSVSYTSYHCCVCNPQHQFDQA